jgi:hypothetical protein
MEFGSAGYLTELHQVRSPQGHWNAEQFESRGETRSCVAETKDPRSAQLVAVRAT